MFALAKELREWGLFSLEKKLRGDPITMFQYLKVGYKEDGDSLFPRSHIERTGGMGTSYSWGDSDWTQEEQSLEQTPQRSGGCPSIGPF